MQKSLYSKENDLLLQLLVQVRIEAGVTQVELAARLDEVQPWISRVERGVRRLDLVELLLWCEALDMPLSTFIQRYEQVLGRH
ncbi:helix-turn-helix domain-containing protein [Comamonas terrigena]|uniref:helix-turn-helix domain-containing protein n=1 Tax=Comamonas terrigena TaxID=32013 RepID=UPI00244CA3D1|nr:helix-turn-helix transcriptional regulator [Comamonas terrigena]MDH0049573.1 helix-turn-helix domain-containing protein [Comamonas terrigena]MDH0512150.1 helix-turn-helix domain-containing protein [Comamonas terrigena]MDH1091677.1 helix-turn-helix domain-containing protein [Comamonas terrigena]